VRDFRVVDFDEADASRRGCNLPCGEDASGHLIEEGLEQMVMGVTDQRDGDRVGWFKYSTSTEKRIVIRVEQGKGLSIGS
jgi:hypothetical protein